MKPNKITVHCSDTPNGLRAEAENIAKQHKLRGIDPIGYHGVIQPNGEWQEGRPLNVEGAHVLDHNAGNIGICLVGNDKFTRPQLYKLFDKIKEIQQCLMIDQWEVYTHNQFDTAIKQRKTCPNISINDLLFFIHTDNYKSIEKYIMEEKI